MARRVGPGLWEWVLICTLAVAALGMGYGAGDVYANGWCQSCNAAKAGTPCPTGGACTLFENICAIGACNAPSAATGTCVWGPIFSGCYKASCPTGTCPSGDTCECANPGKGC